MPHDTPPPVVVLVHGLGRSPRSLWLMEHAARRRGYRVVNVGYPSRRGDVGAHARTLVARVERDAPGAPLLVVTHSLGGIVLRQAVASGALPAARVRRAVMLAPPSRGSELADAFTARPALRWIGRHALGPAAHDITTGPEALAARLGPVPFEVGVIAGRRSINPLLSRLIAGPDDGKVGVARAGVPGMRAMATVPHTHTFLMNAPRVVAATFAFLETGAFGSGVQTLGAD